MGGADDLLLAVGWPMGAAQNYWPGYYYQKRRRIHCARHMDVSSWEFPAYVTESTIEKRLASTEAYVVGSTNTKVKNSNLKTGLTRYMAIIDPNIMIFFSFHVSL